MMIVVAVIIIFARKLIPRVSDDFVKTSYGVGGLMLILTVLYAVGYLKLILYELIAVPLALIWLMRFFNALIELTEIQANYTINIIKK